MPAGKEYLVLKGKFDTKLRLLVFSGRKLCGERQRRVRGRKSGSFEGIITVKLCYIKHKI